ncbi:unnamed protein product (macronuclear) [Paramecium tetraurelia]|uniref:non-specific serine/threonine protein kinase n=1 Tax=Paramecium tetraurelia TaxID=5888 RepID=A0DCP1_PARTE|nr:uncharacterized protein GSPATT00015687001 [Paramecium tetraurelia]CAK80808.1 unnamed protein product [Paramecium tetraurelia]|eukprot:XP_001448205.1 hypothetical protein (macronuclear) [Paramecium tetraurelia strain d4-2]
MDTKVSDSNSPSKSIQPSIQDYISIGSLGRGTYGEVILEQKKQTINQQVAIKVINKKFLTREQNNTKLILKEKCFYTLNIHELFNYILLFKKPEKNYILLWNIQKEEISLTFQNYTKVKIDDIVTLQFYLAQIDFILQYIHSKGIAHRDLKPENLMLSKIGHLKLIDFGTYVVVHGNKVPTEFYQKYKQIKSSFQIQEGSFINRASFVGTAEYDSPEMLEEKPSEYAVDLWALGIIFFKMFTGATPFNDDTQYLVFYNVKNAQLRIPDSVPKVAADLIQKILVRKPSDRLGSQSMNDLKSHPFFKGIQWDKLFQMQTPQPKVVSLKSVEKSFNQDLELGRKSKSNSNFMGLFNIILDGLFIDHQIQYQLKVKNILNWLYMIQKQKNANLKQDQQNGYRFQVQRKDTWQLKIIIKILNKRG